jgi:hypothetical protein
MVGVLQHVAFSISLRSAGYTRSVNKVMRLIQYNSVLTFTLQIEFVPFKIVPLGGYTPPETLFPLFVATLVVANLIAHRCSKLRCSISLTRTHKLLHKKPLKLAW